jgi:hypothetical protein
MLLPGDMHIFGPPLLPWQAVRCDLRSLDWLRGAQRLESLWVDGAVLELGVPSWATRGAT